MIYTGKSKTIEVIKKNYAAMKKFDKDLTENKVYFTGGMNDNKVQVNNKIESLVVRMTQEKLEAKAQLD